MRIVAVRQGSKYGPEYPRALAGMIDVAMPGAEFMLLGDGSDADVRLTHGWPGWWAKLELFRPDLNALRPFLFLDLDVLVMDDLAALDMGDCFTMIADFYWQGHANSSAMWVPRDVAPIWETFTYGSAAVMAQHRKGSDQTFLEVFCSRRWGHTAIQSYKAHGLAGVPPPGAALICFHGRPKPHDCGGWAERMWRDFADC